MVKVKNIDIYDLYFCLILLLPLTTLFQNYIDFVNRLVFVAVFVLQLIIISKKTTKKQFIILLLAFASFIITIISTENFTFSNSVVYFVNFIIYTTVFLNDKERFFKFIKDKEYYIKVIIWLWTIIVGITIPFGSFYYIKEGGDSYFGSIAGDIFRLAPTAVFISILSIIAIVFYKNRKYILFQFIPLYCGFMGSSRTYFVCFVILFVIALYCFCKTRKNFYLSIIIFGTIGILVFFESSMFSKVVYTLDDTQYGDFWFRITSSRSVIWTNIINGYSGLDLVGKMFGGGFGFSNSVSNGHYSHNDFIEILAIHGIFGIALYLFSIFMLFKAFYNKKFSSKFITVLIFFVWLFNAMFNMFYTYTCTALSLPFLLSVLDFKSVKYCDNDTNYCSYSKICIEQC